MLQVYATESLCLKGRCSMAQTPLTDTPNSQLYNSPKILDPTSEIFKRRQLRFFVAAGSFNGFAALSSVGWFVAAREKN